LQCAQRDALRQFDLEGIVSERAGINERCRNRRSEPVNIG
jgi:hypothetical protein